MTTPLDRFKLKQERRKKSVKALEDLRANPDPDMVAVLSAVKKNKDRPRKKER